MICEMCGKEVPMTKTVIIEGSRMDVCPGCARFGEDYRASVSKFHGVTGSMVRRTAQAPFDALVSMGPT